MQPGHLEQPVLHQPTPSEGARDINRAPRSQAASTALEGWRKVPHLQLHTFAAAAVSTHPIESEDWRRQNDLLVNCIARVCKGRCRKSLCWRCLALASTVACAQIGGNCKQPVAPAEGPVNDSRLLLRIRITDNATAPDMSPWWIIVNVTSLNIDEIIPASLIALLLIMLLILNLV